MNKLFNNNKAISIIFLLCFILSVVEFLRIKYCVEPIEYSNLSNQGQYLAGTVGLLISFLALAGLLVTYFSQRKQIEEQGIEIKENRIKNEIQTFENNFFQLLNVFLNMTENFKSNEKRGVEVLNARAHDIIYGPDSRKRLAVIDEMQNEEIPQYFRALCNITATNEEPFFGHYYRALFQLLKFVNSKEEILKNSNGAKFYINLIRNQLNQNQLHLLFFIALSDKADFENKKGINFKILIEKYKFFEYLRFAVFQDIKFIKTLFLFDESAYNIEELNRIKIQLYGKI